MNQQYGPSPSVFRQSRPTAAGCDTPAAMCGSSPPTGMAGGIAHVAGNLGTAHTLLDEIEQRLDGPAPAGEGCPPKCPGGLITALADAAVGSDLLVQRLHGVLTRLGGG